jgi:hypothetical protein
MLLPRDAYPVDLGNRITFADDCHEIRNVQTQCAMSLLARGNVVIFPNEPEMSL